MDVLSKNEDLLDFELVGILQNKKDIMHAVEKTIEKENRNITTLYVTVTMACNI